MLISGIQPCTFLDFPEKTACIVFTPGCNFRCAYCHNPEFVLPERIKELRPGFIPEETFFRFLDRRQDLLDGVVVTGGEPTLMPDLLDFLRKVKDKGFKTKLDTNGNRPAVLRRALDEGLVDYVAMDVKTSLAEYQNLAGPLADPSAIAESIELLKASAVPSEFRSTILQELHPPSVLDDMAKLLVGAKILYLQKFRPGVVLKPEASSYHPFSDREMMQIADFFRATVPNVIIRS
ncbi:MAG: anaerobic ribonucleoside-triphosphate reductase activating protein [Patescibacteria group bacterium]|jgi:pyruvate formate lyase activating enzyme